MKECILVGVKMFIPFRMRIIRLPFSKVVFSLCAVPSLSSSVRIAEASNTSSDHFTTSSAFTTTFSFPTSSSTSRSSVMSHSSSTFDMTPSTLTMSFSGSVSWSYSSSSSVFCPSACLWENRCYQSKSYNYNWKRLLKVRITVVKWLLLHYWQIYKCTNVQ